MRREQFIEARQGRWEELELLLDRLEQSRRKRRGAEGLAELPRLYRQACQDLALAKHRQYGRGLVQRLNRMALRGHEQLHQRPRRFVRELVEFVRSGFPRRIREDSGYVWLAAALFYGPFVLMGLASWLYPPAVQAVLDPETMSGMEQMYDPAENRPGTGRGSQDDIYMFGHYIYHNIGIAFRTFAGGVLAGLGSIFFLMYNGVVLGAVFGHLTRVGYHGTLYPFVIGHGAFELTAIVLAGAAGMKLGFAILAPGRRSRSRALVESGQSAIRILFGAAGMLLVAAFIEGFWSPSSAPDGVKYTVGALLWLFVAAYFLLAGRSRAA